MFARITRIALPLVIALVTGWGSVSHATEESEHGLALDAPQLFSLPLPGGIEIPFSNSMVMLVIAVCLISLVIRLATLRMKLIPSRIQNLIEAFFEVLYNFVEKLLGTRLTRKYFWYFGTIFTIILCCNYMGLLPGVGIITYTDEAGQAVPLFRGANADMNVTMFLGLFFAFMWFVWSIREQGIKHFLLHLFGPKGKMKGFLGIALIPVFFFVGLIECLSIGLRPIALAARLFGNVFAGESIIETMSVMGGGPILSSLCVLPFMLMEILIGFIQALVFLLLAAIFLKLQVGDDPEDEAPVNVPEPNREIDSSAKTQPSTELSPTSPKSSL